MKPNRSWYLVCKGFEEGGKFSIKKSKLQAKKKLCEFGTGQIWKQRHTRAPDGSCTYRRDLNYPALTLGAEK